MDFIKNLEQQIRMHRDLYYNKTPKISDAEFDELIVELERLAPESKVLKEVGAPVSADRKKIKHSIPVGSIDSVKSNDEIIDKFHGCDVVLTPKLDGLTVVLYYNDGKLVQAAKRGDGAYGEDIMHHIPYIPSIKTDLDVGLTCIVRGEAKLFDEDHKTLGYANRRNGASGVLNHKTASVLRSGKIQFTPFEIFVGHELTKVNRLQLLHQMFPLKIPFEIVEKDKIHEIGSEIESFISDNIADPEQEFGSSIDFQTNKGNRYSVDGVIVSKDISKSGTGDLAWKLFDKVTNRTTEVQYVEWNTTRTGNVFPTIKIRSIELDGVVIKRVTGESADFIIDNQIGPGAIVEVIRANGVIPKIQKVIQSGKLFVPFECSCCGSNLEKIGAFLFCKNPKCELVLYKKLVNSLMQLKIDGLQEATIQILVKHFFGEEIPSIVEFVDVVLGESLVGIKGIGSKKSNQIKQNLSAIIHETDLVKIMISMGIPGLGRSISEVLLMKFQTIETIFKEKDNKESFTSIEMIGDKVYENLLIGLTESEKIFKELFQNSMNIPYGKSITEESKLKNFVLTGKFEKKRTEMAKLIEEKYGWKFSKSLNKKVDYLIVGSKPGSKVKKAKKMGIKIIEEAELI